MLAIVTVGDGVKPGRDGVGLGVVWPLATELDEREEELAFAMSC